MQARRRRASCSIVIPDDAGAGQPRQFRRCRRRGRPSPFLTMRSRIAIYSDAHSAKAAAKTAMPAATMFMYATRRASRTGAANWTAAA